VTAPAPISTRERGQWAEDLACAHLQARGLRLLCRNYRCRRGEIDLIMSDGASTVFVEVRYRRRSDFGSAAESVDRGKRNRLAIAAQHYLASRAGADAPCRFDVVSVAPVAQGNQLQWIPDAFQLD